jgi:acetyltransferase-like isoleucine patch superfamily enzyme
MRKAALVVFVLSAVLPWSLRRALLRLVCGFTIDRSARISRFALILCRRVELGVHAYIGAFTVCKGMDLVAVAENGYIGPFNWITVFPMGTGSRHFELDPQRKPQLIVEQDAAITSRHLIDCTDEVRIGAFSTFAGFRSQILTHSIDLKQSRQRCKPVRIGHHCFVGTGSILLGGSSLPDCSVLAAHSLLTSSPGTAGYLYGGVPAKAIKAIDSDDLYFSRTAGYVL